MQQQRQLRLGDILDDYCPRERRLANHTIVAMVGDEIRLTRCTTCDTEHPYKGGKAPRLRKKSPAAAAYDEVLESVKKESDPPNLVVPAEPDPAPPAVAAPAQALPDADGANGAEPVPEAAAEEIRLHRPLIRASLPRIETQKAERPIPEFTIRQASRQGRFQNARAARFAKGRGAQNQNGNSHHGNSRGPGGAPNARNGRPQGQGGRPPGQYSGKKRSR